MDLSDRFRSILKKKSGDTSGGKTPSPDPVQSQPSRPAPAEPRVPAPPPPTAKELDGLIQKEKTEGESRLKTLDKEIQDLKMALEKTDLAAKGQRDAHQQTLQFLQQDAERELKFLDRKLTEDTAAWTKQVSEREKALTQAVRQVETNQFEKKTSYEKEAESLDQSLAQSQDSLKEQEAKLQEERKKWRQAIETKDHELVALKQELSRRETGLENELKEQEAQRRAAQELWQTRTVELDRQWAEKRKIFEESMKAKEEERLRLHATFQEKQAAWQLEQERRLQDLTRRQERAAEKAAALKAHLVKETQVWQQLTQTRDEQLQQLKVKLLLSETEVKTQLDQAQKVLQEVLSAAAAQVQSVQRQVQQEQDTWQKALETKEAELKSLQDDVHGKMRRLETDYKERLGTLLSQKEDLTTQMKSLEQQYAETERQHEEHMRQLNEEQGALQTSSQKHIDDFKRRFEEESAALQAQIGKLEMQKGSGERELETLRLQWKDQLTQRDQAIKEIQVSLLPQETELKKRYAAEEESITRQVDALKTRSRALDRELAKIQESVERLEKDHRATLETLEKDFEEKEDALQKRSTEQVDRLTKRLEERRVALDAFMTMKKDEEARIQNLLRSKEKERADLAARLANLPQILEETMQQKKDAAQKESATLKERMVILEKDLAQAREQSKSAIQAKANQISGLRQTLEAKHKEAATAFRTREQILESERAGIEKQMTAGQAEMDRIRTHWQTEIDKKEQESVALQEQIRHQDVVHRQTLEQQQKTFEEQRAPVDAQRIAIQAALQNEQVEHDRKIDLLEKQIQACQADMTALTEKEKTDRTDQEVRYRQERAQWKAKLESLRTEQEGVVVAAREALAQKNLQVEQLEDQLRQQAVSYEARRREAIHQATLKSRTLQDMVHQLDEELKSAREAFPREIAGRESQIVQLTQQLAGEQARHQQMLARFERAMTTLVRRGKQKEEVLHAALTGVKEEWAKKLASREAEIGALQADLLAKETERQGELDRLAKQFAEERFVLEKSKDELEWKLKDHKEVSERQLAGRQKEVQFLQNEINRLRTQRDEQVAQKTAAFETEKKKWQVSLAGLQKQGDDERQSQEEALGARERDLQLLLAQSKHRLTVLGEEFTQKVSSWRATNEALRGQIEQFKSHLAQAQDHWEALRKEKAQEIAHLRQEAAEWEQRLQNELKELVRVQEQDQEALLGQIRRQEKEAEEAGLIFQRRLADKETEIAQATDDIEQKETASETQWQATLEQWQTDKQALQSEKLRLEQDLAQLQRRSEQELRETEEAAARLRMEITFKETQLESQRERRQTESQKELDPLRERLDQLATKEEQERSGWESRLSAKDEEIKMNKARLAWREKRLHNEMQRREKELSQLRRQVDEELQKVRADYEAERKQLEQFVQDRRAVLTALQKKESALAEIAGKEQADAQSAIAQQRHEAEESLRHLLAQREELIQHYQVLLVARDNDLNDVQAVLKSKDAELESVRQAARAEADELRKKLDLLRTASRRTTAQTGPKNAGAWAAFESGVNFYQVQRWPEAVQAFEECIRKDPRWGAAYQYLALSHHALGQDEQAILIARQALEYDAANPQLGAWVDRLHASIDLKQKKAS